MSAPNAESAWLISGITLLGRNVPIRDDLPHGLSFQQRLLLAQQHEILALVHAKDEDGEYESRQHQRMAEVLREGYAGEYDMVFGGMEPEMPRSACKLVWDILNMFRMLSTSIDRLSAADRATLGDGNEHRLRFGGFDLNDSREGRLLGYVRYLVDTDRWTEIKLRLAEIGDDGNSHGRTLVLLCLLCLIPSRAVWFTNRFTCSVHAHGSGVWLPDLANLCLLSARPRSLVADKAGFIPRIFRIMKIGLGR